MANVMVTGASTGIGRATAAHLVARGHKVFAGVRKPADADALTGDLGDRLVPLLLDVTDADQVAAAAREVELRAPEGLHGLVNNAGIAVGGPLEHLPIDEVRRQLEVNVVAQVAVTQALLPAIRRTRRPRYQVGLDSRGAAIISRVLPDRAKAATLGLAGGARLPKA